MRHFPFLDPNSLDVLTFPSHNGAPASHYVGRLHHSCNQAALLQALGKHGGIDGQSTAARPEAKEPQLTRFGSPTALLKTDQAEGPKPFVTKTHFKRCGLWIASACAPPVPQPRVPQPLGPSSPRPSAFSAAAFSSPTLHSGEHCTAADRPLAKATWSSMARCHVWTVCDAGFGGMMVWSPLTNHSQAKAMKSAQHLIVMLQSLLLCRSLIEALAQKLD